MRNIEKIKKNFRKKNLLISFSLIKKDDAKLSHKIRRDMKDEVKFVIKSKEGSSEAE